MTTLGDLLAGARACSAAFQPWLEASDPELAAEVTAAAAAAGLTATGYVRMAIADFSRFAPEEDWATLVSSLRDSPDPGSACLLAMVHWRLNAEACDNHSHSPEHKQEGAAHERSLERQG